MKFLIELEGVNVSELSDDNMKELKKELTECNWINWNVGDIFYSESFLSFHFQNLIVTNVNEDRTKTTITLKAC